MSFSIDWELIGPIVGYSCWTLLTIHWVIIAFLNNEVRHNGIHLGCLLPIAWSSIIPIMEYSSVSRVLQIAILVASIVLSIPMTFEGPYGNPDKAYRNFDIIVMPTIKSDWTMALPVLASLLLFLM